MSELFDIVLRVDRSFLEKLDSWRRRQASNLGRPEAVKMLVEEAIILKEALDRLQSKL